MEQQRIDRGIIYQHSGINQGLIEFYQKNNIPMSPNSDIELFYEGLLFVSNLIQEKNRNLFGFYEFDVLDFSKFTNRSRSDVSEKVDGWEHRDNDSFGNESILCTKLEKMLYTLWAYDLPVNKMYTYGSLKMYSFQKPGQNSILSKLDVQITKKTSKKTYIIDVNKFYIQALLQQFVQVKMDTLKKARGKRITRFPILFYLLESKNECKRKNTNVITPNIALLQKLCNISFDGLADETQIHTRLKSKIIKILEDMKSDDLDFVVTPHPNNKNILQIIFNLGTKYIGDIDNDNHLYRKKLLGSLYKEKYDEYLILNQINPEELKFDDFRTLPIIQSEMLIMLLNYLKEHEIEEFNKIKQYNYSFYRTYFEHWNKAEFEEAFKRYMMYV